MKLELTLGHVDQLEGLSLALSHSLPSAIDARRPTVPGWAAPTIFPDPEDKLDLSQTPLERAESDQDMSYWKQVKATLDEEALALKEERRRAWEARLRAREQGKGGGSSGRLV